MNNLKKLSNLDIANKPKYSFTNCQEKAIDGILNFIDIDRNIFKSPIGLNGAGGTGKTFITKYIINNCKYSKSVIRCTSPTHKACRVFGEAINDKNVDTIQSVLGFRLDLKLENFDPRNPQFNPKAKHKLDNIKVLIIDESSMLPKSIVNYVISLCKKLEIKLIFIGDNHQLPPAKERKSSAFDRCSIVYTLNELVRQEYDNPVIKILNVLRKDIDNNTHVFLETIYKRIGYSNLNDKDEGYIICNRNDFEQLILDNFHNEEYTKNIDMFKTIAYTNDRVVNWNNFIRNSIIKDADKKIINTNDLIMSYETIVNDFLETIINNSEEYIVNDIVDYVDEDYQFKGFLVRLQAIHGGVITRPLFVIDHTDKFTIMKYYKVITSLEQDAKSSNISNRSSKWKKYYSFKKKYLLATNILNNFGDILYSRDIDYGFAMTAHKSQGSTYGTVFVDIIDMVYDKRGRPYTNQNELLRRLYTACSRTKKKLILCCSN